MQVQQRRLRDLEDRVRKMRQTQWQSAADEPPETDGWLLSYLDLLTLLLVMFVVMLAVSEPRRNEPSEQPIAMGPPQSLYDDWDPPRPPPVLVQSTAQLPPAPWTSRLDSTWESLTRFALPEAARLPAFDAEQELPDTTAPLLAQELPHTPVPALIALAPPRPGNTEVSGAVQLPTSDWAWPAIPLEPVATPVTGDNLPIRTRDAQPAEDAGPPALPPNLDLTLLGDGIDVIVNERSVSFRINNEILFALGQATLTDTGQSVLERVVDVLADNDYPITVEGHTDPVPIQNDRFPSNWELSTYRATSVLRNLIDSGIDPARLRAIGYADTRPIADNDSGEGRALNRRVELILETPPGVASDIDAP